MKLTNKDGSLTAYAFACGYIQAKKMGSIEVELYKDGCWHVRIFKNNNRIAWESFDSMGKARNFYKKHCSLKVLNAL